MKIVYPVIAFYEWVQLHWRGIIVSLIITALAALTLGLQVSTQIDGQNKYETETLRQLEQLPNPTERMMNAPYLIPSYAIGSTINNMLIGARITSVIYGLLATCVLFVILKRWFSTQTAAVGSLLFITSSWVLAISHQATPFVLLVIAPLLLLASLAKFSNTKDHVFISFLLLTIALAFAAYVPYMFWPMLTVLITLSFLYRHKLLNLSKKQLFVAFIIYVILLLPALISLMQYPGQLREFLGIPLQLPDMSQYVQNFIWQFSTLFIFSQPFPELYLGRLPVLDIFSIAMLILGIYHFAKFMPKRRQLSFGFIFVVLAVIIPLNNTYQVPLTAYIPIVYILIAAGTYELLRQWFSYFPRNPFARNGAVVLLAILIGLSTSYNMQKFYIAWPNATETKAAYMVQSNKQ